MGAFDGYLLRVSRKCLSKQANVKKYFCRKQFHAINCQVGCDADRRITYLSIMCPGATPDILAHCAGPLHGAILDGQLDPKWQLIGDAAFPSYYDGQGSVFLIPFTRAELRDADTNQDRDSYNYYLSQIRINIECCFGMLVNKFRVLTRALETTRLSRAVLTFRACCALHNFVIDCRLSEGVTRTEHAPNGHRLIQRPDLGRTDEIEFVEVPTMVPGSETVIWTRMHARNVSEYVAIDRADAIAPTREEMVQRIRESGYIRPRTYGEPSHTYTHY